VQARPVQDPQGDDKASVRQSEEYPSDAESGLPDPAVAALEMIEVLMTGPRNKIVRKTGPSHLFNALLILPSIEYASI
jgi:hypothetical protein